MDCNFQEMKIGYRIACPRGTWREPQRAFLELAGKFANTQDPRWQFQAVMGRKGSEFDHGQYWLERTQ